MAGQKSLRCNAPYKSNRRGWQAIGEVAERAINNIKNNGLDEFIPQSVDQSCQGIFPHNPPVNLLQKQGFSTFSDTISETGNETGSWSELLTNKVVSLPIFATNGGSKAIGELSFQVLVRYQAYQAEKAYFHPDGDLTDA